MTGRGSIGFASAAGFPIDIRLQFDNAQLARSDDIGATATGDAGDHQRPRRRPDLGRPRAAARCATSSSARPRPRCVELAGVRRRGEPIRPPGERAGRRRRSEHLAARPQAARRQSRVRLRHGPRIRMVDRPSRPGHDRDSARSSATLDLIRGHLSFAGRRFDVAPRPYRLHRRSGRPTRASTSQAVSDIEGVEVGINVSGSAEQPADRLHLLAGAAAGRGRRRASCSAAR